MEKDKLSLTVMYCVNCAEKVVGCRDKDGRAKIICHRCGAQYVSKRMGRRHDRIDVYAPIGQVAIKY